MLSIQTASILGKQKESAVNIRPLGSGGTQREMSYRGKLRKGVCMCVCLRGVLKTVEMRDETLCWFLRAISTVLASFFIHFLKSLDEGVCTILKLSLDEVGGKKKKGSPNFNGNTGEKLTVQVRYLNFLSLIVSKEILAWELSCTSESYGDIWSYRVWKLVNKLDQEIETFYIKWNLHTNFQNLTKEKSKGWLKTCSVN